MFVEQKDDVCRIERKEQKETKQLTECLPREFANSAAMIGLTTEEVYRLSMIRINEY